MSGNRVQNGLGGGIWNCRYRPSISVTMIIRNMRGILRSNTTRYGGTPVIRNPWTVWPCRYYLSVAPNFYTFHPSRWAFIRESNMEMTKLEQQILNDEVVS